MHKYKLDYCQLQPSRCQRENYDIHTAKLEPDATLLGLGLIGSPRQYMQNLNLMIFRIEPVHWAQRHHFCRTVPMQIGKEEAEYEIRENWAILRSIYGAKESPVTLN